MNSLIKLNEVNIKTCNCYCNYWEQVRKSHEEVVTFDSSVEKVLTFRKYCIKGKSIYHVCKNCLHDGINTIPYEIITFEKRMKGRMNCIYKMRNNILTIENCCNGCINCVISSYSSCFLIEI